MTTVPAVLCLAAALAAAPSPADDWSAHRTHPSTWGGTAWGDFRFGMGPADVADRVERFGAPEWRGASVKREGHSAWTVQDELVVQGSQVRLAGAFGTVVFAFYDGQLYQVRFTADSDSFEGADTRAGWDGWTARLVADATATYGKPVVTERTYAWRVGDLEVSTTRGLPQIWFTSQKVWRQVEAAQKALKGGR
ncbi:MAG TPA: hypothetical protein VLT47_10165 [Anaeromyxobacteraceae bacterium]|nr:hypothetical protein [Anaeromyxobacteraceae bacterium]